MYQKHSIQRFEIERPAFFLYPQGLNDEKYFAFYPEQDKVIELNKKFGVGFNLREYNHQKVMPEHPMNMVKITENEFWDVFEQYERFNSSIKTMRSIG